MAASHLMHSDSRPHGNNLPPRFSMSLSPLATTIYNQSANMSHQQQNSTATSSAFRPPAPSGPLLHTHVGTAGQHHSIIMNDSHNASAPFFNPSYSSQQSSHSVSRSHYSSRSGLSASPVSQPTQLQHVHQPHLPHPQQHHQQTISQPQVVSQQPELFPDQVLLTDSYPHVSASEQLVSSRQHVPSSIPRQDETSYYDPPVLNNLPNQPILVHPHSQDISTIRYPVDHSQNPFDSSVPNRSPSPRQSHASSTYLPAVASRKSHKAPGQVPYTEVALNPIDDPVPSNAYISTAMYPSDAQAHQQPLQQNVLTQIPPPSIPSLRSLPEPHQPQAPAFVSVAPNDNPFPNGTSTHPHVLPQPVYAAHAVPAPPQEPHYPQQAVLSAPVAGHPLINTIGNPVTIPSAYPAPIQQKQDVMVVNLFPPLEHAMAQSGTPGTAMALQPVVPHHQLGGLPGMPVTEMVPSVQVSVPSEMLDSFLAVGRACRAIGRYDLAADAYRACIAICPESSEARISYSSACCWNGVDVNRPDFAHSLEMTHIFAEDVFNDIGNALRSLGRTSEAEMAYRAALNIAPRHAHAWNNLGNAMRARGAIIDAMSCYSTSLTYQPGFAAAHCNLAGLLRDQGKPQEAESQYRAALMSDPNLAEAAAGLGTALRDMGRTEEAVTFYDRAVTLQPDAADHRANLANTYKDLNRIEESIVNYQAALSLQPDMPDAFCNMVHSLSVICDWNQRSQNFVTLLGIIDKQLDTLLNHPNTSAPLYSTLVGALSNSTPQLVDVCGGSRSDRDNASVSTLTAKEENSIDVHRRRYVHHPSSPTVVKKAKNKAKYSGLMTNTSSVVAPVLTSGLPSVQPFHALIYPMSPEKFRALSAAYATRAESMVNGLPLANQRYSLPQGPRARLKVGYVSSDYNNHPYSHLTQSIYGLHGTGTTVECYCYALTPSDQSAWRLRIERESEHFRDISALSAKQSAEAIASDGIHVLVNCNGYTKGARTELFALRPAPVQVSFMGFPGTLGAHYIEYFITDVVTSPPRLASRMHSEALLYHPHSYFVNDHRQTSIPGPRAYPSGPLTRAHYRLPENCFLFIMHNQLYKLSPDTFDVWARILKRVPNSKIWLLRFPPSGEQRILQEAAARGLSADRLVFTDVAGKEEHVARAGLGDLFLDTPTCNAHTTGTDVLWSGCPMITCPGSLFASRVAASLLTAAGVPELIAPDMNAYEDLAVELATNRPKLAQIRAKIEASRNSNALFDTARWVRNVEALYWQAWKNFADGNSPRHIFGQDVYDGSTMVSRGGSNAVENAYASESGAGAGTAESWRSEAPLYGRAYNSTVMT